MGPGSLLSISRNAGRSDFASRTSGVSIHDICRAADVDALVGDFDPQGVGEMFDARLGGVVRGDARQATNPANDDTNSTYPRRLITSGRVARTVWNTPSTLTSITRLKAPGSTLSTDP